MLPLSFKLFMTLSIVAWMAGMILNQFYKFKLFDYAMIVSVVAVTGAGLSVMWS
jgi:hypothetical protein